MKTIILVRHAETAMAGRFCGHSDPDLNVVGEMQLTNIVDRTRPLGINRIVSSDLRRTLRTAQAIGCGIGVEPQLRPRLREMHFGLWEGMSWNQIAEQHPHEAQAWIDGFPTRSAPHGEPYAAFCERVDAEFNALMDATNDGATAVVTHRGPMQHALVKFFGRSAEEAFGQTVNYGALIVVGGVPTEQGALP